MGYFLNSKGEMVFSVFDGHSLHGEVAAEVGIHVLLEREKRLLVALNSLSHFFSERSVFSSRNQVEEHELKLKEAFRYPSSFVVLFQAYHAQAST